MRKPSRGITGKDRRHTVRLPEREKIGITTLKGISVLFEDDIYDLAYWLLKTNEARDRGTNSTSRHTVYGLAGVYALAANMNRDEIARALESHGLSLGATIEYDEDV